MKKLILVTLISTSVLISSCSDSENDDEVSIHETSLSQLEIDDLNFLREEEKLARDVYLYSYDLYNLQIFKNVSNSEQKHMDSVLELLNKYNLPDPASENIGEFNNAELQNLYNDLTQKSSISVVDALEVGNIIEDLDIKDIATNEGRTINIDLLDVYTSLKCGSRNHLRNYYAQLIFNGGLYIPTYISIDEFEAIITTSNEQCINN
ncbi:MAG: DUF2202 domain-containing protein [Lutibacter sp.]|uniref:DUF2202 domain-containing protein n=1 Tax=Lutibacter sp. TaxID=1925666 RepID=UPI0019F6C26F|nr:DUF2202 domain-containing protein [Lutibacter sp.]NOR27448.1 DUF2202 domain-containing protein [Lutibacter sp.]